MMKAQRKVILVKVPELIHINGKEPTGKNAQKC